MFTSLLFVALLGSSQALPSTVTRGFTTSPNGPTAEEPCVPENILVQAAKIQLFPCTVVVTIDKILSGRQAGQPCTEDAQCSGPDCAAGGATGVCGEAGFCVCKHVPIEEAKARESEATMNSREWDKVFQMDGVDGCNLFEQLKCGDVGHDTLAFSEGACLSIGHIMFMDMCLPLFIALSQEDQDDMLEKLSDIRDEQEEKSKEGAKKVQEEQEKAAKEAKEKAEKEAKESEQIKAEIDKWKGENALWVKESGDSNTVISIGDNKINFGSVDPWDLVSKIPDLCPGQGCKAGESSFPFDTAIYKPEVQRLWKEGRKGVVTMSIEGSWDVAQALGSRDQLLGAVKLTLDALDKDGKIERKEKEEFFIGPCTSIAQTALECKEKEKSKNKLYNVHEWSMTDAIQVRVTNGPAGNRTLASYISLGFKVEVHDDDGWGNGAGFCSGALGAGAGIAAMFAPPAGPAVAAGLLVGAVFCGFAS